MNKKNYLTPTMQVVKLQHTGMLMTSGDVTATMDGVFEEETLSRESIVEDDFDFDFE